MTDKLDAADEKVLIFVDALRLYAIELYEGLGASSHHITNVSKPGSIQAIKKEIGSAVGFVCRFSANLNARPKPSRMFEHVMEHANLCTQHHDDVVLTCRVLRNIGWGMEFWNTERRS